jgi:hypothetical protein
MPEWFSLRRLFTHSQLRGRKVVTIRIYMDESEGDIAYVASGWACRAERWDSISDAWKSALDAAPRISHFKINDAMGLKGPFDGWSVEARDRKIEAMARVLPHEPGFFGHGCYVARADFEMVKHRVRRIYRAPYFFCVAVAMVYAVASETQIIGADKVDFVLDRSKEAIVMRKLFYSDIKPRFPRLGECLDLDDKDTMPLQAADLSAGALRQLNEPTPYSIPGISILDGIFAAQFEIGPKGLEEILNSPIFKKKSAQP